ncbi:non-ribosomal peptide synthetase [Nocardia terpenica]|uniref:Phenyloxazoline synthase MbtB n=1 Tax=Nocardia terpenica TaxID=455432 RepID=A0A6G9YWG3_9NOCA|nr:non-ribosomal peptide synthetase [Nocardia terpenica]QIS17510.1 amino acid adenylation domain-containing protein [Nocardia terpenica]
MESAHRQGGVDRDEIRAAIARQLGIDAAAIADHDDLIQLGLDSIRTMKLAGGWRKRGLAVNFAQLAAAPTVDGWHALLGGDAEQPDGAPELATTRAEAVVVPDDSPFALDPMQHAYWIGRAEGQELGAVAAHLYVEFDGAGVDPDRLAAAVEALVARHPMLRTRFLPDGTQQTLARPGRPVWSVTDLRDAAADERERALEALRDTRTHQRLAVEDGQVIDIALTLLPDGRTRLHLDVDMLAADAMSYRILIGDLARLYGGERLPEQDYTFRRYLADRPADSGEHTRAREWWQGRLPELPGAPELPRTGATADGRTVRYHHWLSPAAKARVFAGAHARGITPAMVLASVFAETIGGWSAQRRFLLNLPLFHREPVHPRVDGVVGDFTSSVLLEVDVSEPATVTERARALQQQLHTAGAHSAYSGLEVLRDLGRLRGEPVLAPIVYTSALNLGELFADAVTRTFGDPVLIISQGPQVLLDAQVTEVRDGLLLNWDVRANAFPPGMIDAMFARYIDAITRLSGESDAESAGPVPEDRNLGSAGWDAEAAVRIPLAQRSVRIRVNATAGPVSGRALHEGFFAHAAERPEAPAVLWEDGAAARMLTYGRLAAEALAVAGALRAAGVRPGDAVAVQLPKGPDQIVATVGALAAGAVYVPIGFDQPAARRAEILRTGSVVVLLTTGEQAPIAGEQAARVRTVLLDEARVYAEPLARPVIPDPEAIAYVLFTSGSTGKPKGVEVPHRAAMNTIDDLDDRFAVGPDDRALALSALEFDLSVYDIFGLLSAGGAVVAVDAAQRSEPARWVELIARHGVSILNCVPSLLDMLLTAAGETRLDSLRAVLLGGDWVDVALPGRLAAVAPGCRFAGLGGATETAIHSTICEVADARIPRGWTAIPYGTPLRNVQCRVVGPTGHDCADWVTGELWIGGAGVAAGYRGDPDRTAERFLDHAGVRWYRTGDLARYLPDGALEFLGRADHQVKIRGYRVELGEVESALRTLPGVRHAIAAVIGAAAPKLAAVVVPLDGNALDAAGLTAAAAKLLPAYMIPSRVEIVAELPFTPNGKPDRKAVGALLATADEPGEFVGARTDLERALADIVATVLDTDAVGVTDDFFALGGDSVLATAVVARVREWLDAPDTVVSDLFATRTVSGLAHRLSRREADGGGAGRLETVARLYLEVSAMSDEEVLAQA